MRKAIPSKSGRPHGGHERGPIVSLVSRHRGDRRHTQGITRDHAPISPPVGYQQGSGCMHNGPLPKWPLGVFFCDGLIPGSQSIGTQGKPTG